MVDCTYISIYHNQLSPQLHLMPEMLHLARPSRMLQNKSPRKKVLKQNIQLIQTSFVWPTQLMLEKGLITLEARSEKLNKSKTGKAGKGAVQFQTYFTKRELKEQTR